MLAKPPLSPSLRVIELTVTVLAFATSLSTKVAPTLWPKVSAPTRPDNVKVTLAVVLPSYTLLLADAVAVNVLAVMLAVVVPCAVIV